MKSVLTLSLLNALGAASKARRSAAALILVGAAVYGLGVGQPALADIDCPQAIADYADVTPSMDPQALVGAAQAVLCLVNENRVANNVPELAWSDPLQQSAEGHSYDWVSNQLNLNGTPGTDCPADPNEGFAWYSCSHMGSDGSWPEDRIQNSGYCTIGTDCMAISEDTYYGWGAAYATPRAAVDWWMNDPPHRESLLNADYHDAGPGVASGTWDGQENGATYTLDLGARP